MSLTFYNTLTRKKDVFEPIVTGEVKMYNCGPTVYNYAHIGNFRAYMCSDILKRYLLFKGYKVTQVMNITDVDDKTIRDSQKEGMTLKAFTQKYTQAFFEDLETLNILKADVFPRATDYIDQMVEMINDLLKKGVAYKTEDGVYFSIEKFREYGKLSKIKLDQNKAGARVNQDEYDKDAAHDFALWKFWNEADGDVFWETEIGKGRPGWHIECSVMSMSNLGEMFDIHTGGVDLIFPHHENEIAQSEATSGVKFVNYWLHNEYIKVDGKKMSKSLGNFYTLRDLLEKGYSARAIRYLLMSAHYRQQLNFTLEGLEASENAIEKIDEFMEKLAHAQGEENSEITKILSNAKSAFEEAMDDDLNISAALAVLFDLIKQIHTLLSQDKIGVKNVEQIKHFVSQIDDVLGVIAHEKDEIPEEIVTLAKEREAAREAKDYAKADQIRDELSNKGYVIEDLKGSYIIKKLHK